ncbi:MAG: hypothetical protein WA888_24290 [Burkholderiaceae bacterium]
MANIAEFIEKLAEAAGSIPVVNWMSSTYRFAGYETFGFISIAEYPGLDLEKDYHYAGGLRGGASLFATV